MLNPTQDYIVIKPLTRKQSDILHVISDEKHCRGEIVAVGPGKEGKKGNLIPMVSEVGQIVAFGNGEFDFYPKHWDGLECYRVIQEADICFVIEAESDAVTA